MIEDSALTLKRAFDSGKLVQTEQAKELLCQSDLVNRLLVVPDKRPELFVGIRAYEWRLLELAEIPYTGTLERVKEWINLLVKRTYTKEGFSLTGKNDGMLACHNAMITTLLIKLGYNDKKHIEAGINWVINYQSTDRKTECQWRGADLYKRFGGCMKKTPCFYGVVKSMIALTQYKKRFSSSIEIDNKLKQGLEYILQHNIYKRISTNAPIDNYIIKNFYPFSYKSNFLEILLLLKDNDLLHDKRCSDAIEILKKKADKDGLWRSEVSQMKSSWIDFDPKNKPGAWISYMINKLFDL